MLNFLATTKTFTFKAASLAALLITTQAQASNLSYAEKRAAIEERILLTEDQFSPALERIRAVHDIYELIFESDYGDYFAENTGTVRHISLRNFRGYPYDDSDLPMMTALRAHTLYWPLGFDAFDTVAENLQAEETTLQHLRRLERLLKSEMSNLSIAVPNSPFNTPTNRSALQNLWYFRESVQRFEFRDAIQAMTWIELSNERNLHPDARFTVDRWTNHQGNHRSKLRVNLGFGGKLQSDPFVDGQSMVRSLRTVLVDGIGVQSSYFLKGAEYAQALLNFQAILNDATLKSKLADNRVVSVEFDADADQSRDIFKDGLLTLGLEEDQMRDVINLLF